MTWRAAIAGAACAVCLAAAPCAGQGSDSAPARVRFALDDPPRVGRAAPPIVLPYATAAGPGPADQPFTLAKELGNVVIVAFYPENFSPSSTAEWRAFRERSAALLDRGTVLVGVSRDSLEAHVRFARELELPFKLLSDPRLEVARRYDAVDGDRARRVVVVVGRDGRVRYLDPAFAALDPESYVHLAAAVAAAKETP